MPSTSGKLRRNIDLRIVSYAMSVIRDNEDNPELAVAARYMAAASLQLAGGFRALVETCKATASSEAIRKSMEPAQARHCEILFEALSESLEEYRKGGFQELIELMVVFAGDTMEDEDRHGLITWANSLGLCTDPLLIDEDEDEDGVGVVEADDPIRRRAHKPRSRATRTAYREDRFEDLAREAIAKGFEEAKPLMAGSRVRMFGKHPRHGLVHLRWLRCTMSEAEELASRLNKELRSIRVTEPGHGDEP